MADSHTPEYSFFSYWVDWAKVNTNFSSHEISFSERLLRTLHYETDIGSIPRGAQPGSYPTPKHKNNPNWSKNIVRCLWCSRNEIFAN